MRTIRKIVSAATTTVLNFVGGIFRHAEMTVVLTASAIGMNAVLSELPFMYTLPMWIEGAFVIPIASIAIISLLVKSAEVRNLAYA